MPFQSVKHSGPVPIAAWRAAKAEVLHMIVMVVKLTVVSQVKSSQVMVVKVCRMTNVKRDPCSSCSLLGTLQRANCRRKSEHWGEETNANEPFLGVPQVGDSSHAHHITSSHHHIITSKCEASTHFRFQIMIPSRATHIRTANNHSTNNKSHME